MAKKAVSGNGSIRQRSDGRWEGRISLGRDGSGKRVQKSFYGDSQEEVAKKIRQATAQIDEGTYIAPSKMPLKAWLKIWLDEYTGSIKENTLVSYRVQVENNIVPYIGAIKLSALQPHDVQKAMNSLYKRPMSAKSVKNCYGVLHKALSQAVLNGYISKNPCEGVQLPRIEKKEICPLNEDEIRSFLEIIKGHQNEILFKTALFTGMRQAELMGLQWKNVDFKAGTILVCQQLIHEKKKEGVYKFAPTKTDSVRKITPAPIVMTWLQQLKRTQAAQRLAMGQKWDTTLSDLVFTNEFGKNLSNTTLTHQVKRLAERIGKAGFRFHDLRHSYAVAAIRAGDDMKTISSNLGHATISITMDIYASFTDDMAKASASRMNDYICANF